MAQLTVPTLSTKQFTFHRDQVSSACSLVAEASDFGHDLRFGRLYDDACDVGIAIRSHKTGVVTRFYLSREIRDGENELQGWELKPAPESLRRNPALGNLTVTIFND